MAANDTDSFIERVKSGEIEAFTEIIRRHQEEVWRICAFMLRDIEATEDLVQQVFVRAYFKLDRYAPGRDFGAWLRQVARNAVRQEIRSRSRESAKLKLYYEKLHKKFADPERADEREDLLKGALAKCREKLPDASKLVVAMRYDRSLSFGEIASALDRTVAATRQLLSRIRLNLKECVEERTAGL